jgi:hypothetical protein
MREAVISNVFKIINRDIPCMCTCNIHKSYVKDITVAMATLHWSLLSTN